MGFAADAEIDLRDLEQLQHAQSVADVLEHEHEVVVALEWLKLHFGDRFELGDFLLDGSKPRNFVFGESGQADIVAGGLEFLQHTNEAILVDLGQLREMIVREHVGKLGLFAGVILEVHRDLLAAEQRGCFETPLAARNKAAAVRDGDGRPSAVTFDHGGDGGDLGGGMGVRIFWVRLQVRNADELIVGAVDFHSGKRERKGRRRRRKLAGQMVCHRSGRQRFLKNFFWGSQLSYGLRQITWPTYPAG